METESKELLLAAQMLDEEIKRLCLIRDSLLVKAKHEGKVKRQQRVFHGKCTPI